MSEFEALEALGRRWHQTMTLTVLLDQLRKLHEDIGWNCPARSEGQRCCVDHLLDGPDPDGAASWLNGPDSDREAL